MVHLTVLGSGSSGNCAVVSTGETTLLLDAGLSAKQIGFDCRQMGGDQGADGGKIERNSSAADRMACELGLGRFFRKEGCKVILSL
jgi:hypothetical protein